MAKQKKNYLDYIPQKNPKYPSSVNEDGNVVIEMHHKGFYAAIAQKLAKTPKISYIELDKYGSFIWTCIDGNTNVFAISGLLEKEFGKEVEPVMNRVVKYFQILYNNKFITYREG